MLILNTNINNSNLIVLFEIKKNVFDFSYCHVIQITLLNNFLRCLIQIEILSIVFKHVFNFFYNNIILKKNDIDYIVYIIEKQH